MNVRHSLMIAQDIVSICIYIYILKVVVCSTISIFVNGSI